MNKVLLIGRLTIKPEMVFTSSNVPFTKFNVAIDRKYTGADGKKETDFIPVQVWRKQAENVCEYLDKGSLISVEGRIQTGTYQDRDGNKRSSFIVVADNVQFLSNRKKAEETKETQSKEEEVDLFAEFGDEIEEDFLD